MTMPAGWDYRRCNCENNGDYCDYCYWFFVADEEEIQEQANISRENEGA